MQGVNLESYEQLRNVLSAIFPNELLLLTTFAYVRPLRKMGMFTDGLTGTMKRSLHYHEHRRLKNKIELNGALTWVDSEA